ncbi:hypothetical protein [Cupriavidus oxalaticus]|uniref:Uncharacterized protein n=1 Tax=Cupriavidus oxalaticus TaxID=96344 RepID=A0A976GBP5_9BURK|nr:hypothetical protein [Cupriavidus oxalaticus]QRQ86257.1 hypothetical protein JTE91_23910 [Cupriavidus oxalaticus]QRQ95416.1 hypothetical protein JTE92_18350 [Cupriavidus oxalaticus]WQD84073.1 hypothetical protein U0036_06060 [Cupriavidus oxalaticus]SPC17387.1 conserved hypothetical protein [Cupriavidus oxalaticus]
MTLSELFNEMCKVAPAAVVGSIQWLTGMLPSLLLWVTFIYTSLQLYVFVRDKVRRRVKPDPEV